MAVYRKKRANGTLSENWYYRFEINKKTYKGSTFLTDRKEAQEYENRKKEELRALLDKQAPAPESVKKRSLLNFREKITSEIQGESIKLEEAWEIFKKIGPVKMSKIPNDKGWAAKEGYWNDFLCFMKEKHPALLTMRDVTPGIAEEYIGIIKESGKYKKNISYGSISYKSNAEKLSPSTINKYIINVSQIFRILAQPAGLVSNPFSEVRKVQDKSGKRDVYEIKELQKIDQYLKALANNKNLSKDQKLYLKINEALFTIGINTGLRRGDICLLRWGDVKFDQKMIDREVLKTGERVFVPMTENLFMFLIQKDMSKVNDYVTPELAKMYRENQEGVTYRFKNMLKELNIETLKAQAGRTRKISSKDIHSLRHTFCYLHGIQGTPLVVVQSMVGHMDKKMTEAYMMHQTEELKRDAIKKFSMKPFQPISLTSAEDDKKAEAIELIKSCSDNEISEILSVLRSLVGGKKINDFRNRL